MKVAFDCKGTLMEKPETDKVFKLFKYFADKGCEMIIWSSLYSYAHYTAEEVKNISGIEAEIDEKLSKIDARNREQEYIDLAVDDDPRSSDYLAVKNFIWVHDIPEDSSKFDKLYGHFFEV